MNATLTVGSLFSGIGLLDYGLHQAGLEHRWFCESDPWRREILAVRWPGVPIFDDVRSVGAGSAERVDVAIGGFPCKGASTAGLRTGFDHPETVLWREMACAVRELQPRWVVVENVANILAVRDGAVWAEVLGTLATLGYDTSWDCFPAAAFGAPHLRDRVIAIAAHADQGSQLGVAVGATPDSAPSGGNAGRERGPEGRGEPGPRRWDHAQSSAATPPDEGDGVPVELGVYEPAIRRWEEIHGPAPEPLVRRVDARSARRVERSRLSALGDGVQVQLGLMVGEHLMRLARCECSPGAVGSSAVS